MRTVLLVEPHAPTLSLLAEQLRLAGFRVLAAGDAPEGLELFAQERPDAVVLAADLPRIGELSLGRRIREAAGGDRLPLVAIDKAHLGKTLGVTAVLDVRADAYFADPTKQALLEKVRELAARSPRSDGTLALLARPAAMSGALDPQTFPARVLELARERRDGIVVAEGREVERRILFRDGRIAGFDSSVRPETPIRWLFEKGLLTAEKAGAALAAITSDGLAPAAALVSSGALAAGEPVLAAMRSYTMEGAARLLGMRDGRFRFHEGPEHAELRGAAVPAHAAVMEAARSVIPAETCLKALTSVLDRFPRASGRVDLAAFELAPLELQVAGTFDGRLSLRDRLSRRGELRTVLPVVWALTVGGALEYAPSAQPARATPPPFPARRPPLPAAEAAALREAALRAMTGSYFQALGLGIAAGTDDVERAYHEMATRFAPERLTGFDLGDLADLLASLQERLDAAYRVLASEDKRAAYTEHLLRRLEPTSRVAQVMPEAEIELKRGVELLGSDPRSAAAAFERAIEKNPKEPAYYAYLAWARFRGATVGSTEDRAKDARRVLRKGLAARPDDDRLIAILGILEAEGGEPGEARRHLSQALRLNGENRLARAALRRLNRLPG